jgi:PAS domain S-box-containing protein
MDQRLFRAIVRNKPVRLHDTESASRQKVEAGIQQTEAFLETFIEQLPVMLFIKDADTLKFVRFNKAGEELLGYSRDEMIGKNDYDFFPKEEADYFTAKDRDVLRQGSVLDIPRETIQTRHHGERILHTKKIPICDDQGKPQFLLGISEDITDKIHAENARQEAENKRREIMEIADRMNTISILAAGMAHEINNPLQGMLSHLGRIKRHLTDREDLQQSVAMVEQGAETIAALVHKLLRLGEGKGAADQTGTPCDEALTFVERLISAQFDAAGITLDIQHAKEPMRMAMPHNEIIQILLNLLINARDALPDGGTISLSCQREQDYGVLRIRDNGTGMTPEVQQQIFTPFFTTKGTGGTGLGLPVAASMIRKAGGDIEVDSTPGEGTTFTVRLPITEPSS